MYEYHDLNDRKMKLRDWRKALRTPATYRVGNTVRLQPHFIILIVLIGVFLIVLFYYNWLTSYFMKSRQPHYVRPYNATYPFTVPTTVGRVTSFRIGIVADLDTNSKSSSKPYSFNSYYKRGYLDYNAADSHVSVRWDEGAPVLLTSSYSHKGRGMELSELIVFDGRLLTFDDRSGMIFEIQNNKMIPWVVLSDGNGHSEKGFKSEWATVKDETLYVGSMGKEWTTTSGKFENYDPMWIKVINTEGEVQHLNWVNQYKALRSSIGIQWPGYMIHESGVWSTHKEKWYFLPRRCSKEAYNETKDEMMGCNYLITADNGFGSVQNFKVDNLVENYQFWKLMGGQPRLNKNYIPHFLSNKENTPQQQISEGNSLQILERQSALQELLLMPITNKQQVKDSTPTRSKTSSTFIPTKHHIGIQCKPQLSDKSSNYRCRNKVYRKSKEDLRIDEEKNIDPNDDGTSIVAFPSRSGSTTETLEHEIYSVPIKITKHQPKLGFSSFKFIPGTNDEVIVALKTTEFEGKTSTYITAFKTDGNVLLDDTLIENVKYEGLEFI